MEEARLLKLKYQAAKKIDPSINQEKVADLCGWAGQSVVSQYLNGKIALNVSALLKFAQVLHFDPSEVSPRLISSHLHLDHFEPKHSLDPTSLFSRYNNLVYSSPEENRVTHVSPIDVWDDDTPLGKDEVEIPFFKEVELSAGQGSAVMLETNGRKLRFGKRTLQRKNIDPGAAGCVPITGNSMEPVLPDGSTVGVDTACVNVQDGKMYALDHDGLLRVKLLYRQPGGGLRLKSYNEAEHPDERYGGEYVNEHIRIIGKVFWYSVLL
ncbi:LexA family transcriptional regulator [Pseudomonas sp. IT-196MI5]|uniref:LexA family transcriptional regulator n=1 Tax=Pseudomonas sp. IT-196MI5 TaxID=3026440 RepID=UPI0039E16257